MKNYRESLPQMGQQLFLTDGGLETTLLFHNGIELPEFAAFVLLDSEEGRITLEDYYRTYLDIASDTNSGFVLETTTWRANHDWGAKLGYDRQQLADINRRSIRLLRKLRDEYVSNGNPIVISGNIGPRGDGYVAGEQMPADEATEYHRDQVKVFADTGADMITAMTLTYAEEAIGIVCAAADYEMPSVIGFTTETDGRLPNGTTLQEAIAQVDAATDDRPAYYMVNCAHTDHFSDALTDGQGWTRRIRAIRANASRLSHAELDEADELDDGDPLEFGELHRRLHARFPQLTVFGGCCGTDHRHIKEVHRSLYV